MDTLNQLVFYFGGLYLLSCFACCATRGGTKHIHEKIAPGALIATVAMIIGLYVRQWLAPFVAIVIAVVASFVFCTLFRYYLEVPLIKLCFRKKSI